MLSILKKIFGGSPKTDFRALMSEGAEIIDVRTKEEFALGHIKGSKNIPLNSISNNLKQLKDKNKTYLLCCASGMRSGNAKSILKSNGYTQVYNAGGWQSLRNKL